ncbi:MAG TPA: 30S ribosomal protein S17 [Candidatus Paceibacterota bacterium]|nr:30S ribosomal protein S17 [Candidatus Paceibacterota bacterium]HRZ34297.1 30S ribosomal protein S17 [Candidatus Paceibacterota bacterium]
MNKEIKQNNKVQKGKVLSGIVRSVKMKDTAVVEVSRYYKHSKYQKYINARKRYKVHDVGNTVGLGDKVEIIECRPISKDKRFRLLSVVAKAKTAEMTEDKE